MDQLLQEIGARLKQARLAKNMTQSQIAEAANISISYLSNLEQGRQAMNVKILTSLLKALNISADWLLNNEAKARSPKLLKSVSYTTSLVQPEPSTYTVSIFLASSAGLSTDWMTLRNSIEQWKR